MNERILNIKTKIKEFLGKLSKKTKVLIVIVLGAVIAFAAGTSYYLNNKPYETLFTGLSQEESSEILGKLQESNVDYKYEDGGTILVPQEQEQQLKAQLISEGYPKSGFTYDVFKGNIDLMTTDFEKENYKIFDLQNRIASQIELLEGVKESKVTIALGQEKKYVLEDEQVDATAAVVVIMKDGGSPSEEQVEGIQRLISRSIPGLTFDNVTIVDGNGRDVTAAAEGTQLGASQIKLKLEKQIEKDIQEKILYHLNSLYGPENVRVTVTSEVNVDKKIRESTNYTPNDTDANRGVPSNEVKDTEIMKDANGVGGVPGAQTNADNNIPNYTTVIEPDGTESYYRNQDTLNYLVNQMKEQSQVDAATLTDLTVSVALNGVTLGAADVAELRRLIGVTAGIAPTLQDEKIAIVNIPFYKEPAPDVLGDVFNDDEDGINWLIVGIAGGVLFLFLLLLIVILVRKKKKKKKKGKGQNTVPTMVVAATPGEQEEIPVGADLLSIKNDRGIELKEQIRDFSEENPEISAQLIKSWLKGGEQDG